MSKVENSFWISDSVFWGFIVCTKVEKSFKDNTPSSSLSISKNRFFNSPISGSESWDAKKTKTDFFNLSNLAYSSIWMRFIMDKLIFFFSWPNFIHLWVRTSYALNRFSDFVRHFLIRSFTSLEIPIHSLPVKFLEVRKNFCDCGILV